MINVDELALAEGLETGLESMDWSYLSSGKEDWLRQGSCGIISKAIQIHLGTLGVVSHCLITTAELPYYKPKTTIPETAQHIFVFAYDDESETVIDASYSQFLNYVGLNAGYNFYGNKQSWPVEKILVADLHTIHTIPTWLGMVATLFRNHRDSICNDYGMEMQDSGMDEQPLSKIQHVYDQIWNIDASIEWQVSDRQLVEDAKVVASFIPANAVTIH